MYSSGAGPAENEPGHQHSSQGPSQVPRAPPTTATTDINPLLKALRGEGPEPRAPDDHHGRHQCPPCPNNRDELLSTTSPAGTSLSKRRARTRRPLQSPILVSRPSPKPQGPRPDNRDRFLPPVSPGRTSLLGEEKWREGTSVTIAPGLDAVHIRSSYDPALVCLLAGEGQDLGYGER